ncbi:transcriptional regulator [Ktedonobacter sp. SOSP1-85]|uniref:helix-turn-helix transcriptional regulator n=1 Tax=Ktedonobacter sp. SOSP1-85 TaxID=2778367 RepID=UPI001915D624|nr:helix-turn-helix transcriptional regulator [Ktedonobacter sp. SOSP1-85]GHO81815.1 transcriptional regulator [Ktedonobacter sp. SOSP1-85]
MRETGKRRTHLADFLKTRRARLRPEQFDLPAYPRRRKPGLRREELAQLVGVGVSWYTWLEQGRDIHVSDQLLSRLADILQLNEQERSHLFLLARDPLPLPDEQGSENWGHSAAYQTILDGWGIYPALLVDRHLDVIAWNESANRVFGDFSSRSERGRNAVWSTFMEPSQRERLVHWEQAARRSIALLRARSDRYANEIWFRELITELHRLSPEFRAWWPEHDILFTCHDQNEINHPLIGLLVFQGTTLVVPERPDLQIVVHTPLSQFDTTTKLRAFMTNKNISL